MRELNVCIGSACHIKGSYNVIQTFQQLIEEYHLHDKLEFKATFCMKECHNAGVCVRFNGEKSPIPAETAKEYFVKTILPCLHV